MQRHAKLTLAWLLVVAVPGAVRAQDGIGPQVAIDHNPSSGLGTNVGAGLRFSNLLGDRFSGYATVGGFYDVGCSAGFISCVYIESTLALLVSPMGFDDGTKPYFGVGGALLVDGSGNTGGSIYLAAGTHFNLGHSSVPFVELQYFTTGGRLAAVAGIYLWK